jgi:hypothetical protein
MIESAFLVTGGLLGVCVIILLCLVQDHRALRRRWSAQTKEIGTARDERDFWWGKYETLNREHKAVVKVNAKLNARLDSISETASGLRDC